MASAKTKYFVEAGPAKLSFSFTRVADPSSPAITWS
jgi:hypothetical protein